MDPSRLEASGKYHPSNNATPLPEPESLKVESLGQGKFRLGQIEIDAIKRQLTIPVSLAATDANLEYALVHSAGKVHESLLTTDVHPTQLHIAVLLLSVKPGDALEARVYWDVNGPAQSINLGELIQITSPDKKPITWKYQAHTLANGKLAAASELSILSLINDSSSLIAHQLDPKDLRDDIYSFKPFEKLPAKGLPLSLIITFPQIKQEK